MIAILPLFVVGVINMVFTRLIPRFYGDTMNIQLTDSAKPLVLPVAKMVGIWSVEIALMLGILTVVVFGWKKVHVKFADGTKLAIGGALLASLNTASEYGFGSVIAAFRASW